jgi:hypothetical protein
MESTCSTDVVMIDGYVDDGQYIQDINIDLQCEGNPDLILREPSYYFEL